MIQNYYHWLHGQWPAGTVEKLPHVGESGATNVPGVRIVGDLSGVPLLKFSSETGVQAVRAFLAEPSFAQERKSRPVEHYDLAIIGGGVSGISAAIEAQKAGLKYILIEAAQPFNTIENFPKGKPIFTYPSEMTPSGGIQYGEHSDTKESLLKDLQEQVAASGVQSSTGMIDHLQRHKTHIDLIHTTSKGAKPRVTSALRCIIAIGRSGNYRTLNIPGEQLSKVMNRLHDPSEYAGQNVAIIGGGDSAVESAVALSQQGASVTLCYRKKTLNRPKPENIEAIQALASRGEITLALGASPTKITESELHYSLDGSTQTIPNDTVFTMIGREAPLAFFRRSGITIAGERTARWWITAALSALFFTFLYLWKAYDKNLDALGVGDWAWPNMMPSWLSSLGPWWQSLVEDRSTLIGTLAISMKSRSFYYTLTYCLLVTIFGIRRIKRRKTPYVKAQTITLMSIQWLPLFIIPEIILPLCGYNGAFHHGSWWDQLFEPYISQTEYLAGQWPEWGHPRAYWRAYGFILAWPLFVYNLFTNEPMWIWLTIGLAQTFILIPWAVRRWGKGAYCGWVCSCGALAETVGDQHRHKMPHGPVWNKLNMVGQVFLWAALLLFLFRIIGWIIPGPDLFDQWFTHLFHYDKETTAGYFSYGFIVDLIFSGIVGVAFYFHLSGRVWCRFACPLAALMHLYSRFSRFRIFADKKKCISCNVCTSVCHQGIDIMNFANKGRPMEDVECVRCSACVQQCPTGVLQFGRLGKEGDPVVDGLQASSTQIKER